MKLSVIIPCYNSTPILRVLIEETKAVLKTLPIDDHEFILVNDGSPNAQTLPFLRQLAEEFSDITLVDLVKNTGQANAQVAALHYVTGDVVVNMDDDMQTHPKNIPVLFNKLMEGYDLVLGKYPTKHHAFYRNLMTQMDNIFETVFINRPKDIAFTSFWIVRRYVVDEMIKYDLPYSFMEGLFLRTAGKIANVEIPHFDRVEGSSGYSIGKLFKLWSNFTGFTVKPLRIAGVIGVLVSIGAFIWAIVLLIRRLTGDIQPGYTSLMCMMLLTLGMVLFFMGLVGEYVGRIFLAVSKTPQYVVKQVYKSEEKQDEA